MKKGAATKLNFVAALFGVVRCGAGDYDGEYSEQVALFGHRWCLEKESTTDFDSYADDVRTEQRRTVAEATTEPCRTKVFTVLYGRLSRFVRAPLVLGRRKYY